MIASNQNDLLRDMYFVGQQIGNDLNTKPTTIHIVAQKQHLTRTQRRTKMPQGLLVVHEVHVVSVNVTLTYIYIIKIKLKNSFHILPITYTGGAISIKRGSACSKSFAFWQTDIKETANRDKSY